MLYAVRACISGHRWWKYLLASLGWAAAAGVFMIGEYFGRLDEAKSRYERALYAVTTAAGAHDGKGAG